jgi:hypothetical protein
MRRTGGGGDVVVDDLNEPVLFKLQRDPAEFYQQPWATVLVEVPPAR